MNDVTAGAASRPRTPSADVEKELVAAATRLLERDGLSVLTVRAIAREAGVAPMGVYNRFGGKQGVIDALFRRGFDDLGSSLAAVAHRRSLRGLEDAAGRYRGFAKSHPTTYAVMFERAIPDFEPSPQSRAHASAAFAHVVALVREAMEAGTLADADATEVAQRLWSTCHGAVSLELHGLGFVADIDRHYRALIKTVLRGLAAEPPSAR